MKSSPSSKRETSRAPKALILEELGKQYGGQAEARPLNTPEGEVAAAPMAIAM